MQLGWLRQTVAWLQLVSKGAIVFGLLVQWVLFLRDRLEPLYFSFAASATIPVLLILAARVLFPSHWRRPGSKR